MADGDDRDGLLPAVERVRAGREPAAGPGAQPRGHLGEEGLLPVQAEGEGVARGSPISLLSFAEEAAAETEADPDQPHADTSGDGELMPARGGVCVISRVFLSTVFPITRTIIQGVHSACTGRSRVGFRRTM